MQKRYLLAFIEKDLQEKMIFLGGPRQVGKTTFSKNIQTEYAYYNWDNKFDRKAILKMAWPVDKKLIILDEIHKYSRWKNFIKGEYDVKKEKHNFFVTGSARLNVYKKGGDSLLGRYHYYRLHPFSYAELLDIHNEYTPGAELTVVRNYSAQPNIIEKLFRFGGFPEPYLKANKIHLQRWHNERKQLLFREDIRDLTQIRDLSNMEIMSDLLPSKVGSTLSLNSLREDLEVTHKSVTLWLSIFEALYYSYRVYPYKNTKIKSLKKEAKLYLWDWSELETEGARLENMVGSHLLKMCHFLYDVYGHPVELFYLRDIEKREVDFLVTYKQNPWFAVEVKLSDDKPSKELLYFKEKLKIPYCYQVIKNYNQHNIFKDINLISLDRFLKLLV